MNLFNRKYGLEARMTLWVTGAVLAVSMVVIVIAGTYIRAYYEDVEDEYIDGAIESTNTAIDLRLSRVEYAIQTTAQLIKDDARDKTKVDSLLARAFNGVQCVDVMQLLYGEFFFKEEGPLYARGCYRKSGTRELHIASSKKNYTIGDESWIVSYGQRKGCWSMPYREEFSSSGRDSMVCYSYPVIDSSGRCYAIICAGIKLEWMDSMIVKYKQSELLDITIKGQDSVYIVQPGEEISRLHPDEVIAKSAIIDRLGWVMRYSIPRAEVDYRIFMALLRIFACFMALLVSVGIAVVLAVRYVARPYVRQQEAEASREAAIQKELDIASRTQLDLVPHTFPPFPGRKEIDLHACLYPAKAVGGDLYDYYIDNSNDEILNFCIGDVSGKGIPASLLMSATRFLFRSVTAATDDLARSMSLINRSLCEGNEDCTFVTFFIGRLNMRTGLLEYCNAGHNCPLLNGEWIDPSVLSGNSDQSGMPLGAYDEAEYETYSVQMNPGDTLLLYTDGVTEAMNTEGKEFGNDATRTCARDHRTESAKSNIEVLLSAVRAHVLAAPQSDDITMLCLKYNG